MDMQSLLFDFYWQYFKVLLIDVHKGKYNFLWWSRMKWDYLPHTAVNISTQYFPGFFIFHALFPDVWTISHFFPLQVFATAFLSPISAFDRNLFRSVSPNLPFRALASSTAPSSHHRRDVVIFMKKFHHKHSSRRLHMWHILIQHWHHSTSSFMKRLSL